VKHRAARLLSLFALLCATLLAALAWLLATEPGLQFLWRQLAARAAPELEASDVRGTLAEGLRIRMLRYEGATFRLALEELELDWEPRSLLAGTLHIRDIRAAGVSYTATAAAEPGPVELPAVVLPLKLRLDALHVGRLGIVDTPGSAPLQLQDIRLAGSATGSRIALSRLQLATPGLTLAGRLEIELQDDYPLQGELDWQWHDGGLAPVDAHTRLQGDLRRLELLQEIRPPYSATARLTLGDPLEVLHIDGTLELADTRLEAIDASWPALRLSAALRLAGTLEQLAISGSANSQDARDLHIDAAFETELQGARLEVRQLQLTLPGQPAQLHAQGRIDFGAADGPGLELQVQWQELAWPPTGTAEVHSASGRLALQGIPADYRIEASASLDAPQFTPTRLQLQGRGGLEQLEITTLQAGLLDGSVQGSAHFAWAPQTAARLELTGSDLNPGSRWLDWPGQLAVALRARLATEDSAWRLHVEEAGASGSLRGQPLKLAARGSYAPGELQLDTGTLSSGPSRLQVRGKLGERLDLGWDVDSPDLATLLPAAGGRLSGSGQLQGTLQAARLTARLSGHALRYRDERVRDLQLQTDLDAGGTRPSSLQLALSGNRLAGMELERIELTGSGTPQAHALQLTTTGERLDARLAAGGSWQADAWAYTLNTARFAPAGQTAWELQQAVSGRVSTTGASLPQACWAAGEASLCLQAEAMQDGRTAALRLRSLPLATLAQLLPEEIGLQGGLDAAGNFRQSTGRPPEVQLQLTTTAGELTVLDEDGAHTTLLAFAPGKATLDLDAARARLELRLPLQADAGSLGGNATLTAGRRGWADAALAGDFQARLPDIAFAGELLPDVSELHGRLDGEIRLAGTAAAPRLQGRLLLDDGSALLDAPGLQLEEVRVELAGRPDGSIGLLAQARSGDGVLKASGSADLAAEPVTAQLRIEGDDVRVMNTLEARIDASPRLDIALAGTGIDVSGQIHVPRASIRPRKLPVSAVTPSPDQVIIEDGATAATARDYPVHAAVRFSLGDDVSFDGLGLKGKLGGSVLAVDEPGKPTRASGEFNITDGRYRAYGQDLEIRRGRLLFPGGPLTEPGLDIEAVRRPASDILAGVKVRGNLQRPELTVFSEPPMPQSEQLSWLVLGRSLQENTSASEQSALNRAALMLGMSGGETIGQELGRQIGVDEVSVDSGEGDDTTSASLLVGKYLTPKLFVSYGIGLFEPLSTLHLRYTLSSRWKLVGKASSEGSSTDLFYVIERGE